MPRYNGKLTKFDKKTLSKKSDLFKFAPNFGGLTYHFYTYPPMYGLQNAEIADDYLCAIADMFYNNSSAFLQEKENFESDPNNVDSDGKPLSVLDIARNYNHPANAEAVKIRNLIMGDFYRTDEEKKVFALCEKTIGCLKKALKPTSYMLKYSSAYFNANNQGEGKIVPITRKLTPDVSGERSNNSEVSLSLLSYHPDNLKILYSNSFISNLEETLRKSALIAPKMLEKSQLLELGYKYVVFWKNYDYNLQFSIIPIEWNEHFNMRYEKYRTGESPYVFLDEAINESMTPKAIANIMNDYNLQRFVNPNNLIYNHNEDDKENEALSFLDGKIHPFILFTFLSSTSLLKTFGAAMKKRKFIAGDSVYIRSSITSGDFENETGTRNFVSYGLLKSKTYKNLLPGMILDDGGFIHPEGYGHNAIPTFPLKAYQVQLFDPSAVILVAEDALNFLEKKRYEKEKPESESEDKGDEGEKETTPP